MTDTTQAKHDEFSPDNDLYLLPLFLCRVQAGTPSPADDSVEERINLNRFIFRNPSSTTLYWVKDDSYQVFDIHKGDILVVDKSLPPEDRKLVLVEINGEETIRLLVKFQDKLFLGTGQDKGEELCEGQATKLLGVVTYSIRTLNE
jgi:DNA polymerase V